MISRLILYFLCIYALRFLIAKNAPLDTTPAAIYHRKGKQGDCQTNPHGNVGEAHLADIETESLERDDVVCLEI